MKSIFTFFILIGITIGNVSAQCDSLKTACIQQKGELQVDALNDYARCFMFSDAFKFDSINQVALQKGTEIQYTSGVARTNQNLGLYELYYNEQEEKAHAFFQKALGYYKQSGDSLGVAMALGDIAGYNQRAGNLGETLKNLTRGLAIFEAENHPRGISVFSNNIGSIYMSVNDASGALPHFRRALNLIDKEKDIRNYSNQLGNMLLASILLEDEDSVNHYFNLVLSENRRFDLPAQMSKTYSNMQSYYEEVQLPTDPIFALRKSYADSALFYANKSQDDLEMAIANYHKGLLFWYENNYENSYAFLEKSINLGKNTTFDNSDMAQAYYIMSEISALKGDFEKSRRELRNAYEKIEIADSEKIEQSVLEEKSRYELHQSQKEMDLIKREQELTVNTLANIQKEVERNEAVAQKQQVLLYAISGGLLLALILAVVAFRAYKSKRKANDVITAQKRAVELQKEELDFQKLVAEEKNKTLLDSIHYAKKIQAAILPSEAKMNESLPNSFVLYKPKDIVSGDFYWVSKSDDATLFAVADCTGYGVPGALVSVVCSNGLTRAINEFEKQSPAEILTKTGNIISNEFSKNNRKMADGMDIAICKLKGRELTFAGANRPLWICREGEIIEVNGDKQSLISGEELNPFTEHTIQLQRNDVVYLFSNGFIDQFGGEEGKKLKLSNLRRFVIAVHSFDYHKQKAMINKAFEDWKGGMEQMDDVCMLGVKILV